MSPEISNISKDPPNFYKQPQEFSYEINQSNQLYRFNAQNPIDPHNLQIQTNFPHLYHEKSLCDLKRKKKRKEKSKKKSKRKHSSSSDSSDSSSNSSNSSSSSNLSRLSSKKYKRGKYHYYTLETKLQAIKFMEEGVDLKEVSKNLSVPPKNLKRWFKVGPFRKKGK